MFSNQNLPLKHCFDRDGTIVILCWGQNGSYNNWAIYISVNICHFQVADSVEERASFHLSSCGDFLWLLSYNCRKNKNMDMHFWWVILWSSKTTFSILQMISFYFLYAINHEHFGLLMPPAVYKIRLIPIFTIHICHIIIIGV